MPSAKVDSEAIEHNDFETSGAAHRSSGSDTTLNGKETGLARHDEQVGDPRRISLGGRSRQASTAALLRNPLAGMTEGDILRDVDAFVQEKGLSEHAEDFRKGALLARVINREGGFEHVNLLTEDDKQVLRHEVTHRWDQPWALYFLVILCAGSAIVQGMDQTAVNGAQEFYFDEFNITNVWQRGLLNGAPYLCSALIGCWTNAPLNKRFGRRGTIFISCFVSFASSFWMAAAHTWWNLLLARFLLGLAVGAKSSTTPVYAAESAPKAIRGALTMMWQMWTAFGIMLGFVSSLAFQNLQWPGHGDDGRDGRPFRWGAARFAPWRWMLASTAIPPMFVCAQVYLCPESPRWYMDKGRFDLAFRSFSRLRKTPMQAARDMYYAYKMLEVEAAQRSGVNVFHEFTKVRRVRRAAQSSFFVMFMQQFCGVNVIAYYSTAIFIQAGLGRSAALLVSFGTGAVNFLFAIPAVYTIDTFGRRNLLLVTFPAMALCMLFTGFSFWIPGSTEAEVSAGSRAGLACITTGIYLFMAFYSPGMGPVPFTYSAEAFPLYVRDTGMSFATATTWGFNFIISLTFPALLQDLRPQGAFGFYGAWNIFGWIYSYFLLPETKNLTLEELDTVFNVGNRQHAGYYTAKLPWYMQKKVLRRDVEPYPPLYDFAGSDEASVKEKNATDSE